MGGADAVKKKARGGGHEMIRCNSVSVWKQTVDMTRVGTKKQWLLVALFVVSVTPLLGARPEKDRLDIGRSSCSDSHRRVLEI